MDIAKKYAGPAPANEILGRARNDCHSNKTRSPGYAEVQPLG